MLIENADYFIRMVPFPVGIGGAVTPNDDGTFSIYINQNEDYVHNREALDHEVEHILQDHFYADKPIEVIEAEASGTAPCKEEQPVSASPEKSWFSSWAREMKWAEAMMQAGRTDAEYP